MTAFKVPISDGLEPLSCETDIGPTGCVLLGGGAIEKLYFQDGFHTCSWRAQYVTTHTEYP